MLSRFWLWILYTLGFNPRGLFVFFDGKRHRRVDPLEVLRAFFAYSVDSFNWDEVIAGLGAGSIASGQLATIAKIAKATREVFDIKPLASGGLSDQECFEVFARFRVYVDAVKKNGSIFPTSQDSTESGSWDDEPNPTRPGGGSGSIESEPLPEQPGLPVEPISET